MATALPILQASDVGTYTPGSSFTPYLTIPDTSFTVGHRYLIISSAEIRSYVVGSVYRVTAWLKYNGTDLTQSNAPYRNESTGFLSCHTCEVYQIPAGAGNGLQLGAAWGTTSGGQIRNMRVIAIDLDVNNTDFPQQNGNGWVYGATESSQSLTSQPLDYASTPQFNADGVSDYLLIACGQVYNTTAGQAIVGMSLGGEFLYNQARVYEAAGVDNVVLLSSCVQRLPNAPMTVKVRAMASGTGPPTIKAAHVFAIRLNTFTKWAGTQYGLTVASGQTWQNGLSVTPTPATESGDTMLVFSCIMGNTWTANTNSMSSQVLRNPGANSVAIGTSFNHRDTTDALGPVLCFTDTADGANSYQQQFKRNTNNDYPGFAYNSVLVSVKAEVGYTAPTKTILPVMHDRDNGWYKTLTATMTDFAWIPGYSFIAGHRYVVFGYAEVMAPNTGVSNFVLRFNGTTLTATDQAVVIQQSSIPTVIQCMDFVTGTGAGVGLTFAGRIESGTLVDYTLQRFRIVAIDLDVNATDLPQQSANGWLTASNDSSVALTTTRTSHCSLTFTPDGDSDYLVIGVGRIRGVTGGYYGYGGLSYDYYTTGGGNSMVARRKHLTAGTERYAYVNMWPLQKPTNAPTKVSFDAYVSGGPSGYIDYSRIFVLRLKTFVKQGSDFANPTLVNDMTVQQVVAATMTPATVAGDQLLIFSRFQAYGWTALGYQLGKYIRREPGTVVIDNQRMTNISDSEDIFGPTNETLEIATGDNTYSMAVQRHSGSYYPTNVYHAALAVISTEVKYVAPTKAYMPIITIWGSSPVAPDSPTWLTQATIGGYRFISGHRYLVIANFSQYVQSVGTYQIRARLVFNGVEMVGCANNDSQIFGVYVPFTIMGMVTGTGGGTGLELQGQKIGASGANVIGPVLTVIDLDVDDSKFPQNNAAGWLWAENLVSAATPTYPSFTTHASQTFTPDGTSNYLIMGDVELYSSSATSSVGYARLLRDGSPLYGSNPCVTDCSTVGTRSHLSFSWLLEAPAAVSTTLELQTSRSGSAYPTTVASRIIIIRLDCFQKRGKQFLPSSSQNPGTTWQDVGPVATLSSAPSEKGEKFLLVAGWQGKWIANSRVAFRLYDPVGLSTVFTLSTSRYSNSINDYKNMLFSVAASPVGLVNPTWRPQDQPLDSGNSFTETQRLMVALSSEFPLSAFEDAAALGSILLSGAAASYRLLGATAEGAIEVLGSAYPTRLVNPIAEGFIDLAGSLIPERLREMLSLGSIQVLGVAHGFTAEGLPLPSIARTFYESRKICPSESMDVGLEGDDSPPVLNRLKVLGSTQLVIDPSYVPTGGIGYSFKWPADGTTNPRQLGFRRGDRIYLYRAAGHVGPDGPNANKVLTIFDPNTLEVFEALVHPDTTAYKFFAVRRGKR